MEQVQELFLHQIKLPADNMRTEINRDEIFELSADIKKNGLISPITVRPKNGSYELVAGQRRYLAHSYGNIQKIKCVIRELTDDEALQIMTSENLARVDVNPVDEANHVSRLLKANGGDIGKVAHLVGRGEKWVNDRLAIGTMPDYMQEFLAKKQLKIGVALVLNQITDEATRKMWTLQAVKDGVSVPMAEYWLYDFRRMLLPGGRLANTTGEHTPIAPPSVITFQCAIDGKEYDTRMLKSVSVYEGNLMYFSAFADAFRSQPPETESVSGGD